jgi:iron complex transport system permease protein
LLALGKGAVAMSPAEVGSALLASVRGQGSDQAALIIGQIRLPRVLLAATVGSILASSGAAMQGLFRNPLADPSLIGVTAGASLGASIVIVMGNAIGGADTSGFASISMVSTGAFFGGLLTVILVYRLATRTGVTSVATMLLAGIAITALAGALGNMLEFYASNEALRRISLWRMGGLEGANFQRLALGLAAGVVVLALLPRFAEALNALLLGESEARYLGVDVQKTQRLLLLLVAVGVGVSVALAGTIAFVGLVVPHLVRLLIGPDHRYLLPASALAGAVLLVLADTFARVVMAPSELPVGVVTALIGVPFFLSLLRRGSRYGML